ncbi:MAG: aldehyde dehydrogenase [Candidatus Nanoarchaeia archaeon]|nr:aldehyde dehydrogenase [Candidatus Nanoarchaeia archaeon]
MSDKNEVRELECIVNGEAVNSEDKIPIKNIYGDVIANIPDLSSYQITRAIMGARKGKKELDKITFDEISDIFSKAAQYYNGGYENYIAESRGNTLKQVRESREGIKYILSNFKDIIDYAFNGNFAQTKDKKLQDKGYNHKIDSKVMPLNLKNLIYNAFNGEFTKKDDETLPERYYEPKGIVTIIPSSTTREIAPFSVLSALAVGNSVIVKADSKEPFSSLELAENLYKAGLPEGALSVLLWDTKEKPELGEKLVNISDSSILFGYDETIKKIAYNGLKNKIDKDYINELPIPSNIVAFGDGRSKSLVWDCENLESAAEKIARSVTYIPSACIKTQYVVVPKGKSDEFIEVYKKAAGKLKTGELLDPETDVGHAIPRNREMVDSILKNAENFGAEKIYGENVYETPTMFYNLHPESVFIKEEIPAPTLGVVEAESLDEAINFINSSVKHSPSKKSLKVGVYTDNIDTYRKALKDLNTHSVLYNKPTTEMGIFSPHQGMYLFQELTNLKGGEYGGT